MCKFNYYLHRVRPGIYFFFAVMFVLMLLTGCGGTRPELGEVEGIVTIDGKPLPQAIVVFIPQAGGRQSMGVTDENGHYELKYIRQINGAKIGPNSVRITMAAGAAYRGRIPARYHAQSTLSENIQAGKNTFNFDLKSS